jgi:predicted secreted protein
MHKYLMGAMMAAAVILAAGSASAAEANRQEVTIPFDFTVHGQTLPAGTYNIQKASGVGTSTILIQGAGANRHASSFVLVTPAATNTGDTSVVFAKAGDRVRLTQVGGWAIAD